MATPRAAQTADPQTVAGKSIRVGGEVLEIFPQIRFYLLQFFNIFAAGFFIGFYNLLLNDFERFKRGAVLCAQDRHVRLNLRKQ